MKKLIEEQIEKRTIYTGRILNVRIDTVKLPNDNMAFREVVEHDGGASVIAVDNQDNIYLTRQYRYPYNDVLLEIPAGKMMKNEDPMDCAKRELQEETGLIADSLKLLNIIYPSSGYTEEKIYIYLVTDFSKGVSNLDDGEFIELVKMPFDKALNLVNTGKIKDCKTIVAIYNYAINYKK